jgi:hypothetical protein
MKRQVLLMRIFCTMTLAMAPPVNANSVTFATHGRVASGKYFASFSHSVDNLQTSESFAITSPILADGKTYKGSQVVIPVDSTTFPDSHLDFSDSYKHGTTTSYSIDYMVTKVSGVDAPPDMGGNWYDWTLTPKVSLEPACNFGSIGAPATCVTVTSELVLSGMDGWVERLISTDPITYIWEEKKGLTANDKMTKVEPKDCKTSEGFGSFNNIGYCTPVPGPIPFLGIGAALGYSRKLRKLIKTSKLPEVISTVC